MINKERFTFRQALLNVTIAVSVVIGLSLSNGLGFYKRPENVGIIALVILVAAATLVSKWKKERREANSENDVDLSRHHDN